VLWSTFGPMALKASWSVSRSKSAAVEDIDMDVVKKRQISKNRMLIWPKII